MTALKISTSDAGGGGNASTGGDAGPNASDNAGDDAGSSRDRSGAGDNDVCDSAGGGAPSVPGYRSVLRQRLAMCSQAVPRLLAL
jgi:hypothetical protein